MPRTLKDVLNYSTAPLVQWEPVVGEEPSHGKKKEDKITHDGVALMMALLAINLNSKGSLAEGDTFSITNVISDEARLGLRIAHHVNLLKVGMHFPYEVENTHLTLTGKFEEAARHTVAADKELGPKVRVVTDIDAIPPRSQHMVVLNMIAGCVSQPGDHANLQSLLDLSSSYLKREGELVMVRPNPRGGAFETYACQTPAKDLKGGEDYEFTVAGLEEYGAMKNIYTSKAFLAQFMRAAGLEMGPTIPLHYEDSPDEGTPAPFLLNRCRPV